MKSTTHKYSVGDSFKKIPLPGESINLVITSPPYPMIEMWDDMWGGHHPDIGTSINDDNGHKAFELMHQLLDKTWREVYRVLKPGGIACINIGDATRSFDGRFQIYHNHSRINQGCTEIGFNTLPSVIWRKPTNAPNKFMGSGMLPGGAYVTLEHEYILILRKGEKRAFTKEEKETRSISAMFWEERNIWYSDLWTKILGTKQTIIKKQKIKSASFPIDIPLRLILMYSVYGDKILDPFAGLGTTTLAAISAGRNSIAIDCSEQLIKLALKTPTKRATKNNLNHLIFNRVADHIDYIKSKDMLFFRYKNKSMGFPVKTLQEKKLTFYPIKSISRNEGIVNAKYRTFKGNDINNAGIGH